mmetsp:Transcript_9995/g.13198  ORF Transcript_9995/g.13198 Transcript_9995/m.13198 type:complete len:578 (+) Transcript_9995:91-1824(+)
MISAVTMSHVFTLFLLLGALLPTVALSATNGTPPPIVYTIAGSDSGGGAGIQADLHAIHNMGCHGCSAITCLTAQNSVGVTGVHAPPPSFLRDQLDALLSDLPPLAIKIGMLGNRELAEEVGSFLQKIKENKTKKVWIVLDPVMISTSGHRLIEEDAQEAMIQHVFPHSDLLTPNLYEAENLLGRKISNAQDVENAARDLLDLGVPAVLIKGGHISTENTIDGADRTFAQDYFLSTSENSGNAEARLCDGNRGVWLRSTWFHSEHTHGTGCTLSSAVASALALGEMQRSGTDRAGAYSSIGLIDACCLAKSYVTAGISQGVQLGQGPGPVAQTQFPSSFAIFSAIVQEPAQSTKPFKPMAVFGSSRNEYNLPMLGRIYPIVSDLEWVEKLCKLDGITDVQLRIKDEDNKERIEEIVQQCQSICEKAGIRLWVNDYWEAAAKANCFGVHVGQEDLVKCLGEGGLSVLRKKNMALGISTHSFGELAVALGLKPSYISLGPVFTTSSKKVGFDPQGLDTVRKWRQLVPPNVPLVAIGGIGDETVAASVRKAGADCIAVIGAVTKHSDPQRSITSLNEAMV